MDTKTKEFDLTYDAFFVGWQRDAKGEPVLALFNVVKAGHPLEGSTVSIPTLQKENLSFPSSASPCISAQITQR